MAENPQTTSGTGGATTLPSYALPEFETFAGPPPGAYTDAQYLADEADLRNSISSQYADILSQLGYVDPVSGAFIPGSVQQGADINEANLHQQMGLADQGVDQNAQNSGIIFSGIRGQQRAQAEQPYLQQIGQIEFDTPNQLADLYRQAGGLIGTYNTKNAQLLAAAAQRATGAIDSSPPAGGGAGGGGGGGGGTTTTTTAPVTPTGPNAPPGWGPPVTPGCFVAGTMVTTPDGQKPIESLKEGDRVMTYDFGEQELVESEVTEVQIHNGDDEREVITLSTGRYELIGTPEHLVWDGETWLALGDTLVLFVPELGVLYPVQKQPTPKKAAVYNIHVSHPDHNYIANGFLVHNVKQSYARGGEIEEPTQALMGEDATPGDPMSHEVVVPRRGLLPHENTILSHLAHAAQMRLGASKVRGATPHAPDPLIQPPEANAAVRGDTVAHPAYALAAEGDLDAARQLWAERHPFAMAQLAEHRQAYLPGFMQQAIHQRMHQLGPEQPGPDVPSMAADAGVVAHTLPSPVNVHIHAVPTPVVPGPTPAIHPGMLGDY